MSFDKLSKTLQEPLFGKAADVAALRAMGTPIAVGSATDAAAHAAATSPLNLRDHPTDGQKDAGNYKKGHVRISGLHIAIENPQGSIRYSHANVDPPWESEIKNAHYGYFKGVMGQDKDHLDVFLKPSTPADFSGDVYVIEQVDQQSGEFDEHKVMLGYDSEDEARNAYMANYPDGWKLGPFLTMTLPEFKAWIAKGSVVQRLYGSGRAVSFVQPQPFLSKGDTPGHEFHGNQYGGGGGGGAKEKYEAAMKHFREVSEAHRAVTMQYRARAVGDKEFLESKAKLNAASKEADAAEAALSHEKMLVSKDVTTSTGLMTPQAGVTHYDRRGAQGLANKAQGVDSRTPFEEFVAREIAAGRPRDQAVAIAYAKQRSGEL
jgi:hypothetical protein